MNEIDKSETKRRITVMQGFLDDKILQIRDHFGCEPWSDYAANLEPEWDWSAYDYRIKPLEFPKLPEGLEWSNPSNKTPEEVGPDWRLLTTLETNLQWITGAQCWLDGVWKWAENRSGGCYASQIQSIRVPISTPFPEPPKPKVMVPLEPEDVPPGSVFKVRQFHGEEGWFAPTTVCRAGISHPEQIGHGAFIKWRTWPELQEFFLIKRPSQDWHPCEKESES